MTATLDWYGCATFRLRVAGVTLMLDAYVDRVPSAAGPGLTADDVDEADWILVGHSHFDHVWGAERIARRTGATLVGSYETVRIMADQGVPDEQLLPVAGGERVALGEGVSARVLPSQHSCVWTDEPMPAADQECVGDLGVPYQEQRARLAQLLSRLASGPPEMVEHLRASDQGARGDGGALVYVIETREGRLLYQDTAGHWSALLAGERPHVAILAVAGRGNVDGEPVQGSLARFVAAEAALLRPRRVIPSHHDDWLPGFSRPYDLAPVRAALAAAAPGVELAEPGYVDGYPLFEGLG